MSHPEPKITKPPLHSPHELSSKLITQPNSMDSFTTFVFSSAASSVAFKADNMPLAAHEDAMIATSIPIDEERQNSGANCYCIVA